MVLLLQWRMLLELEEECVTTATEDVPGVSRAGDDI